MNAVSRRSALKAGLAGAALAAPAVASAQQTFNWKMTSAYAKGAPFYMDGPGSATDLAKRIADMSGGRLKIQVFGAGELVPAFEHLQESAAASLWPYGILLSTRTLGIHSDTRTWEGQWQIAMESGSSMIRNQIQGHWTSLA